MMTFQTGAEALDYAPCRYGASRAVFRGPGADVSGGYLVALGGAATFGKYVADPYPALLQQATGMPVANLGAMNAGPDFYLSDPDTLKLAARARLAVVQLTGADTISNPYYIVHARRNDRFLAATPALMTLFPEVDFSEISFTRHLLSVLSATDPARFTLVRAVLQANWIAAMRQLLAHLPLRRVLLWLADAPPPPGAGRSCDAGSAASGHHRPGRGEPKPRRQGRGVGPHAIPRDRGATGQPTAQSRASP
ncbi:MAG: hypothetical protein B7Z31_10555 [Rhodobacterales bacterium 12-65-15]|nr:MAG: hypothetical protein B7Z31_10555 [Rhodobacterales bacterium 12-65-15]